MALVHELAKQWVKERFSEHTDGVPIYEDVLVLAFLILLIDFDEKESDFLNINSEDFDGPEETNV
ncbi:hypothetical protein [Grimontia marina]|uniref:Uncharacterized protein n=1 Tax=Grimontia marina TaxID=646534 RepID=A0A128F9J0_9GAMM|nr:hypothetical protein [Grimontia marina]CZF83170.1 hypothetical protein GMA8713_02510 [Grimontia marina]